MRRQTPAEAAEPKRLQADAYRAAQEAKTAVPDNCLRCSKFRQLRGESFCTLLVALQAECNFYRIWQAGK